MSSEHSDRVKALRSKLAEMGLDGFIIPRSDEYLNEYVPESAERLAFISGFTGSAGLAVVLRDTAVIWSDGRYTLQLETQTEGAVWQRLHITEAPPGKWLKDHAAGQRIGYDPWLLSADALQGFAGSTLVPVDSNPVDAVWTARPTAPMAPALPHPVEYAGEASAAKRARIGQILREAGQDALIISDPSSLAWLFNLRGLDVDFTPIALGYALLHVDGRGEIFMPAQKMPQETKRFLGPDVTVREKTALAGAIRALHGKTVRYDPASMPLWFKTALEQAGAIVAEGVNPIALPRACKNPVEQAGMREAHRRDGVAMARFLAWLAKAGPTGRETEMSAAAHLLAQRERGILFKGESFPAISGAGEHGAIIHYRVTPDSDRAIRPDEVYLIDSGGQYLDGTTDITRIIWTGPGPAPDEIKQRVTAVLAGHIALAMAVFPEGVAGPHLDTLARGALWRLGLDYDHGTGHGVGSYLSVHEGPANISRNAKNVALQPGMVLSDEPGFYLPGAYGIRLENLVLVQPADFPEQTRKFLHFETLTLAPFDLALIAPDLLAPEARNWLNVYHDRVKQTLAPLLADASDAETLNWLNAATAPI